MTATPPFAPSELQSTYENADRYMKQFTKRLDRAIAKGALLKADRAEILSSARATAQQRFAGT